MCTSDTIVSRDWVDASAQKGAFLPTEPFCIQALADALQRGSTARANGGLLADCQIYLHPSVPGKDGNPTKDNLLTLFRISGGAKVDAAGIGKMMKRGKNLSKLIVMAPEGVTLPEKVSKALLRGAKELPCSRFIEAVQKQLSFSDLFPREAPGTPMPTDAADLPTSGKKQRATLKKLHLELPFKQAERLAKEADSARIEELKEIMKEKKVEIASRTKSYDVKLAKIIKRHSEELAKRKMVQKIELTHMTDRHRMEMAKTTELHDQERSNLEQSHHSIVATLSAQRDALKRELLELKNKEQVSLDACCAMLFVNHLPFVHCPKASSSSQRPPTRSILRVSP